jgi:hypothetical protein
MMTVVTGAMAMAMGIGEMMILGKISQGRIFLVKTIPVESIRERAMQMTDFPTTIRLTTSRSKATWKETG